LRIGVCSSAPNTCCGRATSTHMDVTLPASTSCHWRSSGHCVAQMLIFLFAQCLFRMTAPARSCVFPTCSFPRLSTPRAEIMSFPTTFAWTFLSSFFFSFRLWEPSLVTIIFPAVICAPRSSRWTKQTLCAPRCVTIAAVCSSQASPVFMYFIPHTTVFWPHLPPSLP